MPVTEVSPGWVKVLLLTNTVSTPASRVCSLADSLQPDKTSASLPRAETSGLHPDGLPLPPSCRNVRHEGRRLLNTLMELGGILRQTGWKHASHAESFAGFYGPHLDAVECCAGQMCGPGAYIWPCQRGAQRSVTPGTSVHAIQSIVLAPQTAVQLLAPWFKPNLALSPRPSSRKLKRRPCSGHQTQRYATLLVTAHILLMLLLSYPAHNVACIPAVVRVSLLMMKRVFCAGPYCRSYPGSKVLDDVSCVAARVDETPHRVPISMLARGAAACSLR